MKKVILQLAKRQHSDYYCEGGFSCVNDIYISTHKVGLYDKSKQNGVSIECICKDESDIEEVKVRIKLYALEILRNRIEYAKTLINWIEKQL